MASLKKEKETRTRSWTFVLYPESAPPDWRDRLDDFHIEWVESPLHDRDINGDGQPKKPHIHVLLSFGSVKSYDQVNEFDTWFSFLSRHSCYMIINYIKSSRYRNSQGD